VINLRKSAFGALVGFVVVVAAACTGSSATPAAGSMAPGASSTPPASMAPASAAGDASSLITQALNGASDIKSLHLKFTLSGTIKAAALADASSAATPAGDLTLDGTSIEGDIDVAKSAAHIAVNVPALPEMGNVPITADLILVNNVLYAKTALLGGGAKYMMLPLASLSSMAGSLPLPSLPVSVPSADTSGGLSGLTSQAQDLQKQLQDAGAKAEIVGTDQIGGQDATHVKVTVPVDWINQQITSAEAASTDTPAPGMAGAKLDSATFDVWVYKANNALAQLHLTAASSVIGNIDLMLTITNYDQPVTITAPAASDTTTGGLTP